MGWDGMGWDGIGFLWEKENEKWKNKNEKSTIELGLIFNFFIFTVPRYFM